MKRIVRNGSIKLNKLVKHRQEEETNMTGDVESYLKCKEDCSHVDYTALLMALQCSACGLPVEPPASLCRKGHLYCGTCKEAACNCCKICKQTFLGSCVALDKILSLIARPCKYR